MEKELVKRMASDAGMWRSPRDSEVCSGEWDDLCRFAALIAEECAKECEAEAASVSITAYSFDGARGCARAIRRRFAP